MQPAAKPHDGTGPEGGAAPAEVREAGRLVRQWGIALVGGGALAAAVAACMLLTTDPSIGAPSPEELDALQTRVGASDLPESTRVGLLRMLQTQGRIIEGRSEILQAIWGLVVIAGFLPIAAGLSLLSCSKRLAAGSGPAAPAPPAPAPPG